MRAVLKTYKRPHKVSKASPGVKIIDILPCLVKTLGSLVKSWFSPYIFFNILLRTMLTEVSMEQSYIMHVKASIYLHFHQLSISLQVG